MAVRVSRFHDVTLSASHVKVNLTSIISLMRPKCIQNIIMPTCNQCKDREWDTSQSPKSGVQLTPSEHPGVAALNPPPWLVAAQLENAALSCDAETSKFESRLLPPPAKCKFESSALGASVENGNIST